MPPTTGENVAPGQKQQPAAARRRLLAWYDRHRRVLPWRAEKGARTDPYLVWISEIMLQQTTAAAVGPYFRSFVARWPTVDALAAAALDDVLHGWQGLGYYARARNLHRCARLVSAGLGGRLPDTEHELRALPGIGPYTAAAIAAIAFDRPASAVDGNVERVIARLFAVEAPLPAAKTELRRLAATLAPTTRAGRPGDYAQALMDLGATVCTPAKPACSRCPWQTGCLALARGEAEKFPHRRPRAPRPTRSGMAFWLVRRDGAVLLRRRPEEGLLGGMMEIPSTRWREEGWQMSEAERSAPISASWRPLPGVVRHTFTHFHLELRVLAGSGRGPAPAGALWCPVDQLGAHALPSIMKKVVAHALRSSV